MQFLWKYIDYMVGKGLEWYIIVELLMYAVPNLVPVALAMGVLLSNIMVFGNMGERYELVAIKASGISLRRALLPAFLFVFMLSVGSFLFSNFVIPVANLKFAAIFWDVKEKKPAFDIREGVFYNDIEGFSIKIGKKDKNGKDIYDIIIYDHTEDQTNGNVIAAERGEMTRSEDERFLYFTLFNGMRYEEMRSNPDYYKNFMHSTMKFDKQQIIFDLSQLDMSRTAEDLFKGNHQLKKLDELSHSIDSLKTDAQKVANEMNGFVDMNYHIFDTLRPNYIDTINRHIAEWKSKEDPNGNMVYSQALNIARTSKGVVENNRGRLKSLLQNNAKHEVEWYKKFTLPVACLVLFLIGAPLGAIVRKGGFGWPMVIAILLFLVFYIVNISGEKMTKELVAPAYIGMWMAVAVLTPVGIWLVSKATRDSSLFDPDAYIRGVRRFFSLRWIRNKPEPKE